MAGDVAESIRSSRYREVRKVTLIGSVVDLVLGVAKILVGWMAHSQALIADGVHSLSDLATDFFVLYAAKHSHREADEAHPYGHGRIETLATVGLGVALIAVAIGIGFDSVRRMRDPELLLVPGAIALIIAVLSVVSKEAIYHYTKSAAKRLRSNMLMANAWHSRTDAISSIVVVVGVAGAMMGHPYLDAVAATAVGVMIAKIGFDLVRTSTMELIDTALDPEVVSQIRERILNTDGVRAVHMLRSRRSGSDAFVDVHLQVDPRISVSEGHQIADTVRRRLIANFDAVTDVTVHIDPEDDELESACDSLPLRGELLAKLEQKWPQFKELDDTAVTLHYLNGKLHIDLMLPLTMLESGENLEEVVRQIELTAGTLPEVDTVRVCFQV
jgi:cation diffusion facilitator family transporter